jgi:hypothetical protein
VQPEHGGEPLLVPMVKDAIRRVQIANRRIEVNLDFFDLAERGGEPEPPRADSTEGFSAS